MTRLLALAAFALGWWLGRDYEYREWMSITEPDEMDAVQPADPWPPAVLDRHYHFENITSSLGKVYTTTVWCTDAPCGRRRFDNVVSDNLDLTYNDALARNAIRRTRTDA